MGNNQNVAKQGVNGMGIAGFVLAILGLLLCWIPWVDWVLWLLGFIFSIIGVCRRPRGLAIAGLVISCIVIVLTTLVVGAILGVAAYSM